MSQLSVDRNDEISSSVVETNQLHILGFVLVDPFYHFVVNLLLLPSVLLSKLGEVYES